MRTFVPIVNDVETPQLAFPVWKLGVSRLTSQLPSRVFPSFVKNKFITMVTITIDCDS